jgi:hypothetical protein
MAGLWYDTPSVEALPVMNMVAMRDGQAATLGGGNNVLAVFKDRPNANWIKTVPGRGYFVGVRLYDPTQAFFDKQWKPDNIVKVKRPGQSTTEETRQ